MALGNHQTKRVEVDDWLTPPEIVRALGPFDIDPAATCDQAHHRKPWETARSMYCRCTGGLGLSWDGRVWLNPPYGTGIGRWLAAMANHKNGIALTFARTETGWFQDSVFLQADALFFIARRLFFYRPDGTLGKYSGGAPSVLIAYGAKNAMDLETLQMPGRFIRL